MRWLVVPLPDQPDGLRTATALPPDGSVVPLYYFHFKGFARYRGLSDATLGFQDAPGGQGAWRTIRTPIKRIYKHHPLNAERRAVKSVPAINRPRRTAPHNLVPRRREPGLVSCQFAFQSASTDCQRKSPAEAGLSSTAHGIPRRITCLRRLGCLVAASGRQAGRSYRCRCPA